MKWRILGWLLAVASKFQDEPERTALIDLGRELAELEGPGSSPSG